MSHAPSLPPAGEWIAGFVVRSRTLSWALTWTEGRLPGGGWRLSPCSFDLKEKRGDLLSLMSHPAPLFDPLPMLTFAEVVEEEEGVVVHHSFSHRIRLPQKTTPTLHPSPSP